MSAKAMKGDDAILGDEVAHANDRAVHFSILECEMVPLPVGLDVRHINLALVGDECTAGALVLYALSLTLAFPNGVLRELFWAISHIGL